MKKITIGSLIPCSVEFEIDDNFEVVGVTRITPTDVSPESLNDHLDADALDELYETLARMEEEADRGGDE